MTDLEMTKLCALALHGGVNPVRLGNSVVGEIVRYECQGEKFDPLHDDAQAMALVKQFKLTIDSPISADDNWMVSTGTVDSIVKNAGLNRAIVECVAKLSGQNEEAK